jgi:hypothetical protein
MWFRPQPRLKLHLHLKVIRDREYDTPLCLVSAVCKRDWFVSQDCVLVTCLALTCLHMLISGTVFNGLMLRAYWSIMTKCWEGHLDLRKLYKKSKFRPARGHEGLEREWRYTMSPHSLTSALDGIGSQGYAQAALPPRNRLGTYCTGGWVGPRVQKISPPPGCNPRTVQLVMSQYTDYAMPAAFELDGQHNAPTSLSSGKDRIPIVEEALCA